MRPATREAAKRKSRPTDRKTNRQSEKQTGRRRSGSDKKQGDAARRLHLPFYVIPERFERSTRSLEGCCSIQLSYGTIGARGPKAPFADANIQKLVRFRINLREIIRSAGENQGADGPATRSGGTFRPFSAGVGKGLRPGLPAGPRYNRPAGAVTRTASSGHARRGGIFRTEQNGARPAAAATRRLRHGSTGPEMRREAKVGRHRTTPQAGTLPAAIRQTGPLRPEPRPARNPAKARGPSKSQRTPAAVHAASGVLLLNPTVCFPRNRSGATASCSWARARRSPSFRTGGS